MSRTKPSTTEKGQIQWCVRSGGGWAQQIHGMRWWRYWQIVNPLIDEYETQLADYRRQLREAQQK